MIDQAISQARLNLRLAIGATRRAYDAQRRSDALDLVDAYNGAQLVMLHEDLNKIYPGSDVQAIHKASALVRNLVKWVISESSCALKQPPVIRVTSPKATKTADGQDPLTSVWKALSELLGAGAKLREAERYANLTNDLAMAIAVRELAGFGDRMVVPAWDLYDPSRYAVEQDPKDPARPSAFSLMFGLPNTEGTNAMQSRYAQIVWTRDEVRITDEVGRDVTGQMLEQVPGQDGINPYRDLFDLPLVIFRSTVPLAGEFYGPSAMDLLSQNRQLSLMETQLRVTERMQGFGQLVLINSPDQFKDAIPIGMQRPLRVQSREGEPGDAKFISPSAPIAELRNDINHLIQQAAQAYGLNGGDFIASESKQTSYASGKAKHLDNLRLKQRTEEFQSLAQPQIAELVKKTLLVCRTWSRAGWVFPGIDSAVLRGIPDYHDLEVEVKFSGGSPIDGQDELLVEQARQKVGLSSWPARLMSERPDIATMADAEAEIKNNLEINGRLGQLQAQNAQQMMFSAAASAARGDGETPQTDPQPGVPPIPAPPKPTPPPAKPPAG